MIKAIILLQLAAAPEQVVAGLRDPACLDGLLGVT
jgi:hypothetical protein